MPCALPSSLPPSHAIRLPSCETPGSPSKSVIGGSMTGSLPSGAIDHRWTNGTHVASKKIREPSGDQSGDSATQPASSRHADGSGAEAGEVGATAPEEPSARAR